MASSSAKFNLIGVRFNKIHVDEATARIDGKSELAVRIVRSAPFVSRHRFGERDVIELRVGIVATHSTKDDSPTPEVFRVECTGGFVGSAQEDDGKVKEFAGAADELTRALYWVLRGRLDSVFAVTALRSIALPWDLEVTDMPADLAVEPRDRKALPKGRSPKKKTKTQAK